MMIVCRPCLGLWVGLLVGLLVPAAVVGVVVVEVEEAGTTAESERALLLHQGEEGWQERIAR